MLKYRRGLGVFFDSRKGVVRAVVETTPSPKRSRKCIPDQEVLGGFYGSYIVVLAKGLTPWKPFV